MGLLDTSVLDTQGYQTQMSRQLARVFILLIFFFRFTCVESFFTKDDLKQMSRQNPTSDKGILRHRWPQLLLRLSQ